MSRRRTSLLKDIFDMTTKSPWWLGVSIAAALWIAGLIVQASAARNSPTAAFAQGKKPSASCLAYLFRLMPSGSVARKPSESQQFQRPPWLIYRRRFLSTKPPQKKMKAMPSTQTDATCRAGTRQRLAATRSRTPSPRANKPANKGSTLLFIQPLLRGSSGGGILVPADRLVADDLR